MNGGPQAHLVVLVAGACIAASILAVAAGQGDAARHLAARNAADELAAAIGFSGCSAARPEVVLPLVTAQGAWGGQVREALLLEDHVAITFENGEAPAGVRYRPVLIEGPVDLLSTPAIVLTYDPFAGSCTAAAAPPENP